MRMIKIGFAFATCLVLLMISSCASQEHRSPIIAAEEIVEELVIISKTERWGPKVEGIANYQNIYLYDSGRLVFSGYINEEKQLSLDKLAQIEETIRASGIMAETYEEMDHPPSPITLDYEGSFTISLDGVTRIFPDIGAGVLAEIEWMIIQQN